METFFINSIYNLFIRKNIKFTLINLIRETLKLYIPDNDCECNNILKVCAFFVHEIKLHNRIIFNKKQSTKFFKYNFKINKLKH